MERIQLAFGAAMKASLYSDDILIATYVHDRSTRAAALQYFFTEVSKAFDDDWARHKTLSHAEASRLAEEYHLALFKRVLLRVEVEVALKLKRQRLIEFNPKEAPHQISLPTPESNDGDCSPPILPPTSKSSFPKPTPYSEKATLPPVVLNERRGPKVKTRGSSRVELPLAVALPIDAPPPTPVIYVRKKIYHLLERIFLPRKGGMTFDAVCTVLTCKEIGFSYRHGDGSCVHFDPPPGHGPALNRFTLHECVLKQANRLWLICGHLRPHGRKGNEVIVHDVRETLWNACGWTMESFRLKTGK
ncbi:hypothetical protein C8R46DRAFT_506033 [Mycena filopes]|nr:hypothetical protein C8R46DRAFT_506033 [Mycena filopes]